MLKLVGFNIDDHRFGLSLEVVEKIVQLVWIQPILKMPEYICGIINLHGEIIPVINVRYIFGLPNKETELSDQLIIATVSNKKFALLVDSTREVIEVNENDIIKSEQIIFGMKYVRGVVEFDDGMLLINDIDKFLNEDELKSLEEVIEDEELNV